MPATSYPELVRPLLRLVPVLLIAAACCALLFQHIDLTNTDLGRHLKNGEVILHGQAAGVLHTNFYSYAAGEYPFVNHHWLAGVVFFLVWKLGSFDGLTLFYSLLVILALAISYWTAQRVSNPLVAAALAALIVPIVAQRDQVRPEAFTYLLTVVFYWVLLAWSEGWITDWGLAWLPVLMLLWINLHIGFVFGFLVLGAFALRLWARAADRRHWTAWSVASAACIVAALANPAGIYGLLYPLHIFGNYGYDIAENLSLAGIADRHWSWTYDLFLALLGLSAAVCLWRWLGQKTTHKPGQKTAHKPAKTPARQPFWPQAALLAILGLGGVVMIRNQPLFCLLMVPLLAELLGDLKGGVKQNWVQWVAMGACGVGLLCVATEAQERSSNFGLGLKPGVNNAAEFLRANGITGPLFNDFDIGGYLIYNGYQVFVDGRPEAYPPGFFQNDYIPALSDSAVWERLDGKYHFNAIVISLQDGFPPIEKFILTRVRDGEWAPVYTDFYSLIFVRRNDQNAAVIRDHLIPRSAFR